MKRFLVFLGCLLIIACAQSQKIAGSALHNANSVIRTGDDKIWKRSGTPAKPAPSGQKKAEDEEKEK